jgi:hypothetical protein
VTKDLFCKVCGKPREIGRRLCRACNIIRVNSYARYTWVKKCVACNSQFQAGKKTSLLCKACNTLKLELAGQVKTTNNYKFTNIPGRTLHRDLAEKTLGRQLNTDEIVHHLDENPKNNQICNLIVISRKAHGKLHRFLDLQRVVVAKSTNENFENCWKALIVSKTTTWLETTGVNVIKLWELGNQQPSLLTEKKEEGSETMHEAPVTYNDVGEDIVQTTTRVNEAIEK